MVRLTIASYSFEAIPLDGALAVCKAIGFKGVDIAGFHNRGRASYEPDDVGANPRKFADDLNALLAKHELEAVEFFPQFANDFESRAMNSPDPAVIEKNIASFRGIVEFCRLVGCHHITVLPGVDHAGRSSEQNLDAAAETLSRLVLIGGDAGIQVQFEAHMGSLTGTPELAIALLERVPGLRLTLDYAHFLLQDIPMERIHRLIPYAGHFHIRQAAPGALQTRFNEGTLDFVDIGKRLEAAGYDGCMSCEYICMDWYGLNQLDTIYESSVTKAALEPYFSV